jgi:hypothetical protein
MRDPFAILLIGASVRYDLRIAARALSPNRAVIGRH